jgi:hypothetical protein
MRTLPTVWYVDDLVSHLDNFEQDHKGVFDTRKFANPQDVIDALKRSKRDALLCDIFFYETEEKARRVEDQVLGKAQELTRFAASIGADKEKYQGGINLIENIFSRYKGEPPFPVYAYTSKAPYMLDSAGFDRIGRTSAKWLFKGRYGPATEQLLISKDIEHFRRIKYLPPWLRNLWSFAFASGIIGWCVIEGIRYLLHLF